MANPAYTAACAPLAGVLAAVFASVSESLIAIRSNSFAAEVSLAQPIEMTYRMLATTYGEWLIEFWIAVGEGNLWDN